MPDDVAGRAPRPSARHRGFADALRRDRARACDAGADAAWLDEVEAAIRGRRLLRSEPVAAGLSRGDVRFDLCGSQLSNSSKTHRETGLRSSRAAIVNTSVIVLPSSFGHGFLPRTPATQSWEPAATVRFATNPVGATDLTSKRISGVSRRALCTWSARSAASFSTALLTLRTAAATSARDKARIGIDRRTCGSTSRRHAPVVGRRHLLRAHLPRERANGARRASSPTGLHSARRRVHPAGTRRRHQGTKKGSRMTDNTENPPARIPSTWRSGTSSERCSRCSPPSSAATIAVPMVIYGLMPHLHRPACSRASAVDGQGVAMERQSGRLPRRDGVDADRSLPPRADCGERSREHRLLDLGL